MLAALPDAEVGVIGLKRDETTHRPLAYLERLPDDLAGRHAYIVDPMLATGGSLATACEMLRARGAGAITALCLIAAPEGVERVRETDPSVRVFTAALDPKLERARVHRARPRRRRRPPVRSGLRLTPALRCRHAAPAPISHR